MIKKLRVSGRSKGYGEFVLVVGRNSITHQYLMARRKARIVPFSPSRVAYVRSNEVFNTAPTDKVVQGWC